MSHSPTRHDSLAQTGRAGVAVRAQRVAHRRRTAASPAIATAIADAAGAAR